MGKYALVTGGSRGIGKAICLKFATLGYDLLINFKSNTEEAHKTLSEIKGKGELLQFDVSKPEEVEAMLGGWIQKNKDAEIEILVNNAGIRDDGLMIWLNND